MKQDTPGPVQPLHRKIYGLLRREIATQMKAGDQLESQNELARRFGVSFPTVREALSILAEEGVIERRRGSGTIVVDPHRNQHVAVLSELDITHPRAGYHFRRLTQQLRQWFDDKGYRVRLYIGRVEPGTSAAAIWEDPSRGSSSPEFLEELEAGRFRGVVAVAGMGKPLFRKLQDAGVPVVGNDPWLPHAVNTNLSDLVHIGIDHLVAAGRRKLAFMSWGNPKIILDAMRERDLQLNVQWLRTDLPPDSPGAGWEEFREIWSSPGREKPDGLLVTDDVLFGDALHAIIDAHVRVPQELAIVTHMSGGAGFWAPFPVTRIETDPDAMAAEMGSMLTQLMDGETVAQPRRVLGVRLLDPEAATAPQSEPEQV
jgi:DNA-binding LacI/PurR family transcriptional regulator